MASANLDSREGTLDGEIEITLNFPMYRFTIINDSSSKDLQFKFNSSENYATLKPTETISLEFKSNTVWLSASGVNYRVWASG
jgi:hypothetical protein